MARVGVNERRTLKVLKGRPFSLWGSTSSTLIVSPELSRNSSSRVPGRGLDSISSVPGSCPHHGSDRLA